MGGRYDRSGVRAKYEKRRVIGGLQRGEGDQPSQVHAVKVPRVGRPMIEKIVGERVSFDANIFTDEGAVYRHLAKTHKHEIVVHPRGQYARGEVHIHSLEGCWSLLQRQLI